MMMAEAPATPEQFGPARAAGGDFVQSLDRGLAVIRAFGPDRAQLSLSDVARATGMARAAARRFLLTLVDLGYVRIDGRMFSLSPRVLDLGYAYLSTLSFPEFAGPHMEELVAATRESSSVSVLDGPDIVYVVRVPTARIMTASIAVGTRFPAHATSMGRVLLAGLSGADLDSYLATAPLEALTRHTVTDPVRLRAIVSEVRAAGYAVVDQELEEGLRSVAVPLRDPSGHVAAALNMSAHASRATLDSLRRTFLTRLRATAARIEADMHRLGPGGKT